MPRPSPTSTARETSSPLSLGLALALLAVTLLAYAPAIRGDFIWNDADYVTAPELRDAHGLARIWFELGATEQYYPVLHGAFWLEHRIWGEAAAGYHLANIFQHALCAWLLALVLGRLAIPGARLAAFLFALHPVCVESVAWISEQKNTLSLLFYLLAALGYLRFEAERTPRRYAIATVFFVLALLSKSVTATLPAALLVVFWWRRGRLEWRRDVAPLLPWFALGAGMGALSAWVETKFVGAQGGDFALSLADRAVLAGRAAWFYLGKLLWPADLVFIYPRWTIDAREAAQWAGVSAVALALGALWWWRRRARAPLAAVLFFGGSLFPTLGFLNVYAFIYSYVADHWQYLPCIGVLALAAAALTRGLERAPRTWRVAVPCALVAALGLMTVRQSGMYADMGTFYRTTLAKNPACWMAHNNLGTLLRERGDLEGAVRHLEAALRVREDLVKVHYNLANCLFDLKRTAEARAHYERALQLNPAYAEAHDRLGRLLREAGQPAAAVQHHLAALRQNPASDDARMNLGMALRDLGRQAEALAIFERVVRQHPDWPAAHLNLSLSLSLAGRPAEAMEHYRRARSLNPAIPDMQAR